MSIEFFISTDAEVESRDDAFAKPLYASGDLVLVGSISQIVHGRVVQHIATFAIRHGEGEESELTRVESLYEVDFSGESELALEHDMQRV